MYEHAVYNQVCLVLHCMFIHTQIFFSIKFFRLCRNTMCMTRLAWPDTSCWYTIIFLKFSDLNAHELGCFIPLCCLCYLKGFSVHVHNITTGWDSCNRRAGAGNGLPAGSCPSVTLTLSGF